LNYSQIAEPFEKRPVSISFNLI